MVEVSRDDSAAGISTVTLTFVRSLSTARIVSCRSRPVTAVIASTAFMIRLSSTCCKGTRSPVILGFSGIHLPRIEYGKKERLRVCAMMGAALCESLPVPA